MVNTTSYIRITGTTATTINGITAGTAGQIIHIESVSANLTFSHQSGSASGVNRLYCPTSIDFSVGAPCSVSLIYNGTAPGWVVLANTRTNTVTLADGSATAPSLNFTGTSSNTGLYLAGTDSLGFAADGSAVGNINSSGVWTIGPSGSAGAHAINGRSLTITHAASSLAFLQLLNSSTGSASFDISVAGAGDPYVYYNGAGLGTQWYGGVDNSASDAFCFGAGAAPGAADYLNISASGAFTIGPTSSFGSLAHNLYGQTWTFNGSNAGGIVGLVLNNTDNTNTSSHARLNLSSGGSSGGNAFIGFNVTGVTSWVAGCDNAVSDSFEICGSGLMGTNTYLSISTAGLVTVGAGGTGNFLAVTNQADPGAVTDGIRIGSVDLSAGNATLALRTERAVAVDVVLASTHTLSVQINGTTYKILLST
jgi:hypothetical protein